MNPTVRSKAGLFMLEFTLMLLIFAVSSTVILRLFAAADRVQQQTEAADAALNYAQCAIERLKACDGTDAALLEILGSGDSQWLDAGFLPVSDPQQAVYLARADYLKEDSEGGRLIEGEILIQQAGAGTEQPPLCSLPFGIFYPAERGNAA